MGKREQKTKKTTKRNNRIKREHLKEVCENQKRKKEESEKYRENKKSKPGRKPNPPKIDINDADSIKITVDHFFKNQINNLIDQIEDPRDKAMCTYELRHLTWLGILMFIFKIGSRKQLQEEKGVGYFFKNLLSLSNSDEEYVANTDTMNYLYEKLPPENFALLKVKLVKILMKNKIFDTYKLNGAHTFAVDATDLFHFEKRHCEHCLVQKHNDKTTTYSHKMLEVKLVTELGFAVSIYSESVENIDGKYIKQDCELKAFYRMESKLKKLFPRTQICLLLDGLYACKEIFDICKKNSWEFIVVLKPGSIPTLFKNATEQTKKNPKNSLIIENQYEKNELSWSNLVDHKGRKVYVIFNKRTVFKNGVNVKSNESWVTNMVPRIDNIVSLLKRGGRQRWKIENQGFKEQKCDGFNLKHLYGFADNAWKNYYHLLQIAHLLTQLIRYGDIFIKLQNEVFAREGGKIVNSFKKFYGSTKNLTLKLLNSFKNFLFSEAVFSLKGKIQIRFSSG